MPTHTQLAKEFGVALMTMRQALSQLEDEGLLSSQQGRGTYVAGRVNQVIHEERPNEVLKSVYQFTNDVIASAQEGIMVYDEQLRYVLWNPFMEKLTGMKSTDMIGKRAIDVFPHLREAGIEALIRRALRGEVVRSPDTRHELPQSGKTIWVVGSYGPRRDGNGRIIGAIGILMDITDRRLAEEALKQSELRYRDLFQNAHDLVYTTDLRGYFTSINKAAEKVTGYSSEEILRMNISQVIAPDYLEIAEKMTKRKLSGAQATVYELDIRARDGRRIALEVSSRVLVKDGLPVAIQGICRDITERKRSELALKMSEEALRQQTLHDALSGLPNRTLLHERLEQSILNSRRTGSPFALLLMDLDRFKEINDTFGHHYGDLLLQLLGQRLQGDIRESDTVARLGGDEFAVLLQGTDARGAEVAAGKILKILEKPFDFDDHSFDVGASIGASLYPDHGDNATLLLQRADVAMYVAKRYDSDFALYRPEQDPYRPDRISLAGQLRRAIERGELVLHYQPKVNMRTGDTRQVEALVRWQHPEHGLMSPDQFIPLAEHTGLIKPLTYWVLSEALRQCHLWSVAGLDVGVCVNLSARNLHDHELEGSISGLLQRWQVEASQLIVEVTESAILVDLAEASQNLDLLREKGVQVAIDDFGTGFSPLTHLKRLPVDEIKIDKSFVVDMAEEGNRLSKNNKAIVSAVIVLAHNLGLNVTAEGVENAETLWKLARMDCDLAQGYHLSRPMPAGKCTRWLKSRRRTDSRKAIRAVG
jgi:diguanylate cyclase (GGDEF)-like protein/PAS domain S-box-containing protein